MDWEIRNKSNGLHKEGSLIPKKKETHCTNHRLQRLLSTQICWAPPTIEWMLILQPHVDLPFNLFGPWACKRWLSQIDTKHSSCSKGNRRIYSEPNTGGHGLGTQTRVTLYGDLNGKYPLLAQTFEYLILSWWHCLGVGGDRRSRLSGGSMPLGAGFEGTYPLHTSSLQSLLPIWGLKYGLAASLALPPHLPLATMPPCHAGLFIVPGKWWAKINSSLSCFWS